MLIQNSVSIAASSVNSNVIAGSPYEFMRMTAKIEVGLVGSATGLVATVTTGPDQLLGPDAAISIQNRFPVYPDDFVLVDVVAPGDRIVIYIRNTTGGALTLFFAVKITPL